MMRLLSHPLLPLGLGLALLSVLSACGGSSNGRRGATLQFESAGVSVLEGGGTATLVVRRGGSVAGVVSVDYATADGTASAGVDYTSTSATLAWADGDGADKIISVPVIDNAAIDGDRDFTVTLSGAAGGAAIQPPPTATVTIRDDDTPAGGALGFTQATYSVVEGAGVATIDVTRTGGSVGAVSVDYATADGTATAPGDYLSVTGTLNWPDGDVGPRSFIIPIIDDTVQEPVQTVLISLSAAVGAAIGPIASSTLDIIDDDGTAAGVLEFSPAATCVLEGMPTADLQVTRNGGSLGAVSVTYATVSGTATAPGDYATTSGTLTWADGDALPQTVQVPIVDDATFESVETFDAVLSNPTGGATLGAASTAVIAIGDDQPGALDACFGDRGVVNVDPSNHTDIPYDIAIDTPYMFVVGTDRQIAFNDAQWRIEKRDLLDGSLDPNFGVGGVVQTNPTAGDDEALGVALSPTHMVVVGWEWTGGNGRGWHIEKRSLSTGDLDTAFGPGGQISLDPGIFFDEANAVTVDASYCYIFGVDTAAGPPNWRIDKRSLTTGLFDAPFGSGGTLLPSVTGTAAEIVIDGAYLYIAGGDFSQWVIEKRTTDTGIIDSGFGTAGQIAFDPSPQGGERALALALGPAHFFVGGVDGTPGPNDDAWRTEKRSLIDGLLDNGFGLTGVISFDGPADDGDAARALVVDGIHLYVIGVEEDAATSDDAWRIERRASVDGTPDATFGIGGAITVNPTALEEDVPTAAAEAGPNTFIVGYETTAFPDTRWRIEKRRQ